MEKDPEEEHVQMIEDQVQSGKRKRSVGLTSPSSQSHSPPDSGEAVRDVSVRRNTSQTSKKPRFGAAILDADIAFERFTLLERARSFPLPPFPIEVLHLIMSFIDPSSLGRLMCVSKYFRDRLDPHTQPAKPSDFGMKLPLLSGEAVWQRSRRTYEPGMPPPLKGRTELEMFNLIHGKRCQNCGLHPKASSSRLLEGPWNSGPGPRGVRTIWPFKVKLCANCLKQSLIKESELLHSEHSHLRIGLLSASFTPSLHYIMSMTLAQTPIPAGLNITQYYFRPQIEELSRSAPTTSEWKDIDYQSWLRELDATRQEAVTDVSRLEAWELARKSIHAMSAVPNNLNSRSSASGSSVYSDNVTKSYLTTSSGGFKPALSSRSGFNSSTLSSSLIRHDIGSHTPLRHFDYSVGHTTSSDASRLKPNPQHVYQPQTVQPAYPSSDHGSTDILRMKIDKRSEIQRRCMELDLPIPSEVLEHLPAFHSALSALMPLEETGWAKLKDRLLSEKYEWEQSEAHHRNVYAHLDVIDAGTVGRIATPSVEPVEEDLRKHAFRPVREKLVDFAREYVHSRYAGGFGLTYSSAPQFAADVLMYVRQRFYENQEKEDAEFAFHGEQPPDEGSNGLRTRTLRLEHMRYVFEHAVRPYTELVRKDLFLCSACDTQGRHFAFEAIIQHFASKHTNAFSRGNAVVYWKTEWPAQPPFEPRPGRDTEPHNVAYPPPSSGHSELQLHSEAVMRPPSVAAAGSFLSSRLSDSREGPPQEILRPVAHSEFVGDYERNATDRVSLQADHSSTWTHYATSMPYVLETAPISTSTVHVSDRDSSSVHYHDNPLARHHRIHTDPPPRATAAQVRWHTITRDESDMYHPQDMRPSFQTIATRPDELHITDQIPVHRSPQPLERIRFHFPPTDDMHVQTSQMLSSTTSRPGSLPRSRFVEEQRRYSSPRDRSRPSSTRHIRDSSDRQSLPSPTAETPARNAAERFLESFDVPVASSHNKTYSRPGSTEQYPPQVSRDNPDEVGFAFDRRPNTSQPRRHIRLWSEVGHERYIGGSLTDSGLRYEPYGLEAHSATRLHRDHGTEYDRPPAYHDPYRYEHRFSESPTARTAPHDERSMQARERDYHEPAYYVHQTQNVRRYSNDGDIVMSGQRLIEPAYTAENRSQRTYIPDDQRRSDVYDRGAPYERQQVFLDPETRLYYIQRPERGYTQVYQRIRSPPPPHEEGVYDDNDSFSEPRSSYRYQRRYE